MKRRAILALPAMLAAAGLSLEAVAQPAMTFSIDLQGPTAGDPITGFPPVAEGFGSGVPLDEGAILTPSVPGPFGPNPAAGPGPLPPPGIVVDSGLPTGATLPNPVYGGGGRGLGIIPAAPVGPGGPLPSATEVDALSYGRDFDAVKQSGILYFSVDEHAFGIPGGPAPPNVATEGPLGPAEASADVFRYLGSPAAGPFAPPPAGPFPPGMPGNTAVTDGDGFVPSGAPGVGLVEPNPPGPGPDQGDNLDALDMGTTPADLAGPIFLSLDSAFPDPLEGGLPVNTGTAAANGFVGGDILVSPAPGAPLMLFAGAGMLGLDISVAPDSDDLDALLLIENGDLVLSAGDFLLFSVRRGSAVIGMPDSLFGAPIEEGDILSLPIPTGAGGLSPFPSIFIPAEALGLGTVRTGTAQGQFGDDLDALSAVPVPAAVWLFASALLGLAGPALRRRRMG